MKENYGNETFAEKVNTVTEELNVEDYITSVGTFDAEDAGVPENVVGVYSPINGTVAINSDYLGTERENFTAIHEGIHPLQYERMSGRNFSPEEKNLYAELMEGQASKYTPFESSYPEHENLYDFFMGGFESGYFSDEITERYREVYEALDECEDILEETDFEKILSKDFKEMGGNYLESENLYESLPENKTY
ncbi:MAG: hypothetical protein ACLFQ8_02685 [Candidatus Aenigmatarchaeota archaeon]